MSWKWGVVLVLLFLLVIFTVQNYETVNIQFLFWSFQTSRAIIVFSSMVIGLIIGMVICYLRER